MSAEEILYFAFGSNLCKERLSVSCPSAQLKCTAKLEDYELSFYGLSSRWHGAVATIEANAGSYCWGAVWSISNSELVALDRQEACHLPSGYGRVNLNVCTSKGDQLMCITYEKRDKSQQGLPSIPYKETIIRGAVKCGLPQDYISLLENIRDNGHSEAVDYMTEL